MSDQILTTLIAGGVSLVSAFGSILLKDYLERRRAPPGSTAPGPSPAAVNSPSPPRQQGRGGLDVLSVLLAGVAVAAGFWIQTYPPQPVQLALVTAVYAAPLVLLIVRLREQTPLRTLRYELDVLALWGGFTVGVSLGPHRASWVPGLILWAVSAVIGGLVLAVVRPRPAA